MTQIILGIASNDLKKAERLPSTRDLARRYDIHANTVSSAYRELARRGWVEFRKGSGVYVLSHDDDSIENDLGLDQSVARFFRNLREQGHQLTEIRGAIDRCLSLQRPDHFVLVEPDVELREILVAEIRMATSANVMGVGIEDVGTALTGATLLVMYGHTKEVADRIEPQIDVLPLNSASVVERMRGQTRPSRDALVAVVSRWPGFLRWARTMLIAAGLDADALSFRDGRERNWKKGLRSATFVITDSLMAPQMPDECQVKVFRVLAESSLRDIQDYAERYF